MRRHRADSNGRSVVGDALQASELRKVDQRNRTGQPLLQRRDQRHPTGDELAVLDREQELRRVGNLRRLVIGKRFHGCPPYSAATGSDAFCSRRQIRFGVAGMSTWVTPRCESASTTALMTAAGEPIVPTSPQPFTPIGVCVHSVEWVATFIIGMWSARGMQ